MNKELKSKDQRILRTINIVFMVLQSLFCVTLAIYYSQIGDPNNRLFSCIMMAIASLIPFAIELIFRFRFPGLMFLFYQIYLLFAGTIGSALNVYYIVSFYDIIIHCLAGYVFALLGIFVLSKTTKYSKQTILFVALFCFLFSMACELIWELIEWTADNLFGQTAQGLPIDEYGVPLVTDTMQDMLCNFAGGIVFVLHYVIGKILAKKDKCSLGINFYERDLAGIIQVKSSENLLDKNNIEDQKSLIVEKEDDRLSQENSTQTVDKRRDRKL